MTTRQALYNLIDDLPEGELTPAARYLEFLAYRESEDAWNSEDYQAYAASRVRAAEAEIARAETVSLADATKQFTRCFGE